MTRSEIDSAIAVIKESIERTEHALRNCLILIEICKTTKNTAIVSNREATLANLNATYSNLVEHIANLQKEIKIMQIKKIGL